MKLKCLVGQSDCIILFCLSICGLSYSASDNVFWAEMFVNTCVRETWFIFPGKNPSPSIPSVVISMCHALPVNDSIILHKETTKVKQLARHSSHSIRLHFSWITDEMQAKIFQSIYERLKITSIQHATYYRNAQRYQHDYPLYDAKEFKLEFLRSQWNADKISWYMSNAVYALVKFGGHEEHLPYSIERNKNRHKNLSDLYPSNLFYRVISGRGHTCKHASRLEKLKSLTRNFNAYDRIFCDVFEHYNLPFQGYWNEADMKHHRARFVRDDVLYHFPPEAKVVYYASPKITFVILQREPVTWMFMLRPFPASLWCLIAVTLVVLLGIQRLAKSGSRYSATVKIFQKRCYNAIEFIAGLHRTVVVSAYCGMVLLGILYPLYTWTPDTFADLNRTTDYKICTSFDLPIKYTHLRENFVLNGVADENWAIREKWTPAHYFEVESGEASDLSKNVSNNASENDTNSNNSSSSSGGSNGEKKYFLAALMYDDKMNLWMKGREFLGLTYSIFDKIKPSHDKVLPETRYISVAAGATRLHFVLDAIKWGFTCGVWLRYHNLEMNYYKNVAPLIVARLKREKGTAVDGYQYHGDDEMDDNKRPLTWQDLYTCFVLAGAGLAVAFFVALLENV